MMSDGLLHPDFKDTPYWWEAAAPTAMGDAEPPAHADVLIVGGGYTGLSAALELARGGRSVVVAEAALFGHGASSRNGGGVSAGVNIGKGIAGGSSKSGPDDEIVQRLDGLMRESRNAFDKVAELVEREKIDCHFEVRGRLVGAYTPKHFAGFAAKAETLNRLCDAGARVLPRERLREEMASDYYYGGMTVERAGKIHPSLYHRGLLDACARAGVTLCAHTKVTAVDGGRGGFTVTTSKGPVRCAETIIATNGYTGPLTPDLRKGLVPATSHIIVTEELPEDLRQSLIPNGRTISETPRVLCYYRMTPDGKRVMFGGRARFTDVDPTTRARLIHRMMTERFPQLKDTRVTHSWTGYVAFTYDFLPHLGMHRDMHYALGCNGSGVAMMTYLGYLMARRILQNNELESPFVGLDLPRVPLPGYTGDPWFLPIVGGWYRFLDRLDRLRA
jgi:glycine/D-amino acid oxidase-like deaminating enzyme